MSRGGNERRVAEGQAVGRKDDRKDDKWREQEEQKKDREKDRNSGAIRDGHEEGERTKRKQSSQRPTE